MKPKTTDLQPKIVLGVAAHPDDLEFGAGGTIAKWVKGGSKIFYLVCTDGSKGSADLKMSSPELIKLRRKEQRAAAKILGVKDVIFLDYEDGALECSQDLKRDIVRAIRRLKPDTMLSWDPTFIYSTEIGLVNHTDHRAAGEATLDAVYPLARDHLTMPELAAEGLQPHRVKTLLMMNLNQVNYFEDISATWGMKMNALLVHRSQLPDPKGIQAMLEEIAKSYGQQAGCRLAEGFMRLDLPA